MINLRSLYFPAIFVLPFYLYTTGLPRNHPKTIWRRILTTAITLPLLAPLPSFFTAKSIFQQDPTFSNICTWFGLRLPGLLPAMTLPLLLTIILYSGPLYAAYLNATQPLLQTLRSFKFDTSPIAIRSYIAAPLAEEVCFRCGLISCLLLTGASQAHVVFISPMIFGAAHVHHLYDLIQHQGLPAVNALLMVTAQFMYSTVFGWFAAFLLLRTGHLLPLVLVHSFCNYLGFPDFPGMFTHEHRVWVVSVLLLGIVGFGRLLCPLTEPVLFGYKVGENYASAVLQGL